MASLQVDRASPLEDVMTASEATGKEPQTVFPASPPLPENVKPVDVDDDEDLDDFTAPPYEEKVGNSDDEEEKDAEYSSYMAREEAPLPFTYGESPATFEEFNEDDNPEDEDDDV